MPFRFYNTIPLKRRQSRRYLNKSVNKAFNTKRPKDIASAVKNLNKKVSAIQNLVTVKKNTVFYGIQNNQSVSGDYNQYGLTRLSDFQTIFGTDATDGQGRNCRIRTVTIDNYVSLQNVGGVLSNETATVGFTYFVVSLKPEATSLLGSTGLLNTLTNNTHYYSQTGRAMLNPRYFNIHAVKRFTLTNNGMALNLSTGQSQYGIDKRFKVRVKVNKHVQNPAGDWKAMGFSPDVRDNYYALLFNDNSALDLESPSWQYNTVISCEVEA